RSSTATSLKSKSSPSKSYSQAANSSTRKLAQPHTNAPNARPKHAQSNTDSFIRHNPQPYLMPKGKIDLASQKRWEQMLGAQASLPASVHQARSPLFALTRSCTQGCVRSRRLLLPDSAAK